MLGDQDGPVIDAEMVDRAPGNRPVGRPGSQGVCDEFLPGAWRRCARRYQPRGAPQCRRRSIRVTTTLISSVCPLQLHSGRAGWKDAIAVAHDHVIVQMGAYAGLASPLLHPLGPDSFTVDFSGRPPRGKTITAMVALSCWADRGRQVDGRPARQDQRTYRRHYVGAITGA